LEQYFIIKLPFPYIYFPVHRSFTTKPFDDKEGGMISLCIYEEKTSYGVEKKCIYSKYSPLSSTNL
jgi:hypothetical protein